MVMWDLYPDMERRKVLLGSAGAFTTIVAGCTSETGAENGADDTPADNGDAGEKGATDTQEKHPDEKEKGDEQTEKNGDDKPADIPGFVPDECEIDSDVLYIKEFERDGGKLTVCLVVKTTDTAKLRAELSKLAPALERGISDAEAFFGEIDEIEFTLENKAGETLVSLYLNAARLREFLDGELTNEELISMARDELEQA